MPSRAAQRDRQGGGQNIALQSLVAGARFFTWKITAAPIQSIPSECVYTTQSPGTIRSASSRKQASLTIPSYEVLVHAVHDQTVVERPVAWWVIAVAWNL